MMQELKLSICIVAFNEEGFLPNLLRDLKSQKYPHQLTEIVLVDSMSTDHTKEIMYQFQAENNGFYSIKVLKNPRRIQAAGWNVAIQNATGDVISRIDAHTQLPPEFSEYVMRDIAEGENVVGGIRPCVIENDTAWGRTLLQVENSLFGSSINASRHSTERSYVKTMFHASYRREVFQKVGLFNEMLLRTEDNEMHYRIRQAGYRLCYDPEITSYQYARSSMKRMMKQKYGNGYWIGLTLGVCPGCISIYHLIPMVFVLGIILTAILALFGFPWLAGFLWILYGLFAVLNTVISAKQNSSTAFTLLMPFLFFILHISYGIGTLIGLVQIPLKYSKLKLKTK